MFAGAGEGERWLVCKHLKTRGASFGPNGPWLATIQPQSIYPQPERLLSGR